MLSCSLCVERGSESRARSRSITPEEESRRGVQDVQVPPLWRLASDESSAMSKFKPYRGFQIRVKTFRGSMYVAAFDECGNEVKRAPTRDELQRLIDRLLDGEQQRSQA